MKINVLVSMKSHLHAVTSFCAQHPSSQIIRKAPSGWTTFDSLFCLLAIFDQSNRACPIDFLSAPFPPLCSIKVFRQKNRVLWIFKHNLLNDALHASIILMTIKNDAHIQKFEALKRFSLKKVLDNYTVCCTM